MHKRSQAKSEQTLHVVVAGQFPPPLGGQNINTRRVYEMLSQEPGLLVSHLEMRFTKSWSMVRRAGLGKLVELVRVAGRALGIRAKAPIDMLIFPAGGPHTVPIVRDLLLLPLLALLSRHLVIQFRAAGLKERLDDSGRVLRRLCHIVYSGCCDEAVVLSKYGRRDPASVGIDRITVIPNALEDSAGGVIRRAPGDSPRILSVGHLCPDKGIPQLLQAFADVSKEFPGAELELVGEPIPPYSDRDLEAAIQISGLAGRIQRRGILQGEALHQAYREADLFVFASVAPYESFGMVLIEAMHWSLPLVVTDWRANVEVCSPEFGGVIARDPESGLANSLRAALTKALQQAEHWHAWGTVNRQLFERHYTMGTLRARWLAVAASLRPGPTAKPES